MGLCHFPTQSNSVGLDQSLRIPISDKFLCKASVGDDASHVSDDADTDAAGQGTTP